jgi:hypothetical protein
MTQNRLISEDAISGIVLLPNQEIARAQDPPHE